LPTSIYAAVTSKAAILVLVGVIMVAPLSNKAIAAEDAPTPPAMEWSFDGITGTFDKAAMQRGFQVYKEVCSACHAMDLLSYRNLTALGYSEDQVKAIASEYTVTDGPNDEGDMFERPARPADRFKAPYENDKAARYANNGAYPPDMSLLVKARHYGADYVYGVLTGYKDAPEGVDMGPGMHYNEYYAGHQIAMSAPLIEGQVTFADGTEATVEQMAHDVTTFLAWASEPTQDQRKQMGLKVILFLSFLTVLMYMVKKKIWKDVKK
jgi:ubiquinol-cytochrome c reductase cytochrome c1 subunit